MSNIINNINREINLSPISKINKTDMELMKVLIKEKPELILDLDTLFKSCKICKQSLDNITRYYIAFNKSVVNFNNTTIIIRLIVIDYNTVDKIFSTVIML